MFQTLSKKRIIQPVNGQATITSNVPRPPSVVSYSAPVVPVPIQYPVVPATIPVPPPTKLYGVPNSAPIVVVSANTSSISTNGSILATGVYANITTPYWAEAGSAGVVQSTVNFADTYLWEGATISTNSVGFYLSPPSSAQIAITASNLYTTLTFNGGSGDLEIYAPGNVSIPNNLQVSSISTGYIAANDIDVSTISTSQIDIDGQTLNATPTQLLLNGIPLASISSLSSIADWSLDPAISSVNMANFDLLSTQRKQLFERCTKGSIWWRQRCTRSHSTPSK